jgi:prepilin-type N-terminal cleavage/methylation domain-containing protein
MEKHMKKQSGFTLVELLLVLAIIGILSLIAVPAILSQRDNARDKVAQANCNSILTSIVAEANRYVDEGNALIAANIKSEIIGTSVDDSRIDEFWRAPNPWPNQSLPKAYAWVDTDPSAKNAWDENMRSLAADHLGQVQVTALSTTTDGEDLAVGAAVLCKKTVLGAKDTANPKVLVKIQGLS